jgi:hypothetical protein
VLLLACLHVGCCCLISSVACKAAKLFHSTKAAAAAMPRITLLARLQMNHWKGRDRAGLPACMLLLPSNSSGREAAKLFNSTRLLPVPHASGFFAKK